MGTPLAKGNRMNRYFLPRVLKKFMNVLAELLRCDLSRYRIAFAIVAKCRECRLLKFTQISSRRHLYISCLQISLLCLSFFCLPWEGYLCMHICEVQLVHHVLKRQVGKIERLLCVAFGDMHPKHS